MDSSLLVNQNFILKDYQKSKDYVKSPFRYPGGKFYALKHIIPFIDCVPHDEFREPFVGGGSVFFGKKKSKINWINDLEADLVELYRAFVDLDMVAKFEKRLSLEIATPERHTAMKNSIPSNYFDRVYKTYYLNRTSYCGIIHKPAWGYKDGKSSPPINWSNFINGASQKLQEVQITTLDFEAVISASAIGQSVLLYLDPPYFNADQKRAYIKSFKEDDHLRLRNALINTNHNFCLSYDNCEEIKEMYSWAHIYEKQWLYNTANKRGQKRELGNELIITNYEVKFLNPFLQKAI